MRYKLVGSGRETGIDVAIEVEASSPAEATAKANKLGILVSGSPAIVSAPAVVASRSSHSPLLIASVCANLALAAAVVWTQLREHNSPMPVTSERPLAAAVKPEAAPSHTPQLLEEAHKPAYEDTGSTPKENPATNGDVPSAHNVVSALQEFRETIGPPTDAIEAKYDEFKNRSRFASGRFEITSPQDQDNAVFISLTLHGDGPTAKAALTSGFITVFFINHTKKTVPYRDSVNWIIDGVRFEGKEEEEISRVGSRIGGYGTNVTTTLLTPELRTALARARKVKVQVMGVGCDLSEQNVLRIQRFFSDLSTR